MEVLEREKSEENSSAPTKVVETLANLSSEKLQKIKERNLSEDSFDIYWAVIDREKQESKKVNLSKALIICKEKDYKVALTNPSFEFWLLLHLENIEQYKVIDLYKNKKISNNKDFMDKELSDRLENGYNKKKATFDESLILIDNILRALKQEKLFENELEQIIDNLGSNVGDLIREILNFEESVIS